MEQKYFPLIIIHMKQRFQRNENYPVSLEEILDDMQKVDLTVKSRNILDTQILCNNPKLETSMEDGVRKYTYKPSLTIRNRKDLVNLIKEHQSKGLGGILMEDVKDSMTTDEFNRIFAKPSEDIVVMVGKGKNKVLFYNDKTGPENLQIEEDIIKYWREVNVEGINEASIEEYLGKQGIASMKDAFEQKLQTETARRKTTQRGRQSKKHNVHMGDTMYEFNPDLDKK